MIKAGSIHFFLSKKHVWILIPVLFLIFCHVIGFNGLYGQDSFEYLRYSRALHEYLSGGGLPGTFFWPVLYPLSGALVSFLLPDVFALQVVSIFCFGMTILFLRKILLYLYPARKKEIALYLVLFFSISPFVMRYSSVVMSDSMTMFFLTAFLYYYFLFKEKGLNRHFILLSFFAFAAINTRYASIAVVFIPGVDALTRFIRNFKLNTFLFTLLIVAIVFLPNIILEIQGSPALAGSILVPGWSLVNFFHRSFFSPDGHQTYNFPNISFVFSNLFNPGYILPGLLFLLFLKREIISRPFLLTIVIVILAYALFLAGLTTQNSRFLLATFPCVIMLYSESFFRCWDFLRKTKKYILYSLIVIITLAQMALFYRAFKPFYEDSRTVKEIAVSIKAYPGITIYTFNIDMGLKAYGIKNEIINLWSCRINYFKPGSLVLFNYINSSRQWKNMNPLINWEKVKKENGLILIEKLPGGWNLYGIKN